MKYIPRLAMIVVVVVATAWTASALSLTIGDHTWEEHDDAVFGADSITYDSATGLEWLDLTETTNRSYDSVMTSLTEPNDPLYGFQYATADKLSTMFGLFNTGAYEHYDYLKEARQIVEMLGGTRYPRYYEASGLYADIEGSSVDLVGIAVLTVRFGPIYGPYRKGAIWDDTLLSHDWYRNCGSWLVRVPGSPAPVPEPATLMLFGVGLVGCWSSGTRRRIRVKLYGCADAVNLHALLCSCLNGGTRKVVSKTGNAASTVDQGHDAAHDP